MELNNKCLLDLKIKEQKGKINQLRKDLEQKHKENYIKKEMQAVDYENELIMILRQENQELKFMIKEKEEIIAEFQRIAELASKKIEEVLKINDSLMKENKKLREEFEKMRISKEEMKKYNDVMLQNNLKIKNNKEIAKENNEINNNKSDNKITNNVLLFNSLMRDNEINKDCCLKHTTQLNTDLNKLDNKFNFVYCNSCCNFALNNRSKCFYPSSEYNVYKDTLKSFY
jgi:hypothetical protein